MKLIEIIKENSEEFDEDLAKHDLELLCHNIYRKITHLKPASKKMEIVVKKGRSYHIEEHEISIAKVIFVDNYHTAPYFGYRNKTTDFLKPGLTHKKFGMVFEMSDGDELDLGGTIGRAAEGTGFIVSLFTGGIHYGDISISPKDSVSVLGRKKEIELKRGDFKKINARLTKSNWDDLSEVALDAYQMLNKQRIAKLESA